MMRHILPITFLLLVVGCQSSVVTTDEGSTGLADTTGEGSTELVDTTDEGSTELVDTPADDSTELVDTPADSSTALKEGTYAGEFLCENTFTSEGFTTEEPNDFEESWTISASGLPLIEGSDARVGLVLDDDSGAFEVSLVVTEVTETSNGVTVHASAQVGLCANTCVFRFDGECDELLNCDLGTDCADCGEAMMDVSSTNTFTVDGDGIQVVRSVSFVETNKLLVIDLQCEGILVP